MKHGLSTLRRLLLIGLMAPALLLGACGPADLPAEVPVDVPTEVQADLPTAAPARIGVYDSRAVAIAWAGTRAFEDWMGALQSDYQRARDAGDQKKVEELEAEGEARQQRLHMQVFSTAPIDDILARIEASLPEIKQNSDVTVLVSKWDQEALAQYPSAEQVDLTMVLVDAFHPSQEQREIAIQILESEPISLEEAEQIKDW